MFLQLQEDLENYQRWKLMNGKASLKLTAKLRVFNEPTSSKCVSVSSNVLSYSN